LSELPIPPARQRTSRELIEEFFRLEAAGGIVLVIAAIVALLWANTPWRELYADLLHIPVVVQFGALRLDKPLLLWINDALMAVFFLLVGLEIKREVVQGELSSMRQAALPCIAALGGMLGPALIYSLINWGDPVAMRGWPIPAATDIAFAVGVLALLGARAPSTLKIFLLALAIIDLNLAGVRRIAPYVLVGILVWICVLKSGVHATLAGVALGFAIPLRGSDKGAEPPLRRLEHMLHPWVTYGILPVFAFANAGVSLAGLSLNSLLEPVTLGVALGLFLGKQLSVFGITWIAVQLGIGEKPAGASWLQLYGMSVLTGIGFTMSLFIGTLAFEAPENNVAVRLGVLCASVACGAAGYLVLYLAPRR